MSVPSTNTHLHWCALRNGCPDTKNTTFPQVRQRHRREVSSGKNRGLRTISRCTELGAVLTNLSTKRIQVGRTKVQSAKDPAEQWLGRAKTNMAGSPLTVSSVLPATSPRMPSTQLSKGQRAVSSLPGRKEGELKLRQCQMRGVDATPTSPPSALGPP